MQPSSPRFSLYGTAVENTASATNEIRQYTYASAMNSDQIMDMIEVLNKNLITVNENIIGLNKSVLGLQEDFRLLARVLVEAITIQRNTQ